MILLEKSHQNLSDRIQLAFNEIIEFNKKQGLFLVKILEIQVIKYIFDYAHSFFRKDF